MRWTHVILVGGGLALAGCASSDGERDVSTSAASTAAYDCRRPNCPRAGGRGRPLVAHEAFWFAWSQFHPASAVWIP